MSENKVRDDFENWYAKEYGTDLNEWFRDGEYPDLLKANRDWEVWQAAIAHNQNAVDDALEKAAQIANELISVPGKDDFACGVRNAALKIASEIRALIKR